MRQKDGRDLESADVEKKRGLSRYYGGQVKGSGENMWRSK